MWGMPPSVRRIVAENAAALADEGIAVASSAITAPVTTTDVIKRSRRRVRSSAAAQLLIGSPSQSNGPVTDERAAGYPRARSLSNAPPGRRPSALLQIALDGVCVARPCFVGILPGLLARTPLAQQVPAAVELDLDGAQPLLILLQPRLVCAVRLLATAKLVLLGYEALDPGRDALVAHRRKR